MFGGIGMLNKLKGNRKLLELIMSITFAVIGGFYIIYKISNSVFMVVIGLIILSIGFFTKDPTLVEENNYVEQLTITEEEALKPSIIENKKSIKKSKRVKA